MSDGVDLSGFLGGLAEARQRAIAAAARAVDVFGEQVVGNAMQYTPVKTGALQASGTTEPAAVDGDAITKEIGFNISYAAPVHERLNARHDVGQAKFLETAMRELSPKFGPFVGAKVQEAMG